MQHDNEREAATKTLIADLMELALDNKLDEGERSFVDSSRRYCELRNEAVRLGWKDGKLVPLGDMQSSGRFKASYSGFLQPIERHFTTYDEALRWVRSVGKENDASIVEVTP